MVSTPLLRGVNSRNCSISSPFTSSFQSKKLLHLSWSPPDCRMCSTALDSRAEHHLALLHPSHPAGSGCIHLPLAQRGHLVRFSSEERMETRLKRNRLFSTQYLGVREGRVMTKQRGPEEFSSCNCQVLLCCQMCSISHPIYFISLDF